MFNILSALLFHCPFEEFSEITDLNQIKYTVGTREVLSEIRYLLNETGQMW